MTRKLEPHQLKGSRPLSPNDSSFIIKVILALGRKVKLTNIEYYTKKVFKKSLQWITGLNVRAHTMNFLQKSMWVNIRDLGVGNDYLDMTPNAQATTEKLNWT